MNIFWLTQTAADVPAHTDWLHPSELEVLSKFRFPKKRNDWLLGRWTAKKAVQRYLNCLDMALETIAIVAADDGAPEVFMENRPAAAFISLSHSHGQALCVVGPPGSTIGCDLEKIEPRSAVFVDDYFTEKEKAAVAGQEPAALWINLIWSAKESALKALRSGLRMDPRRIEIVFSPDACPIEWRPLHAAALHVDRAFQGWWRQSDGFVFTVLSEDRQDRGLFLPSPISPERLPPNAPS